MLSLTGVPAIYIHSLFGSRGDYQAFEETGKKRSINRRKFNRKELEKALADPSSREAHIFEGYKQFLQVVRDCPAFQPFASQEILYIDERLFALVRHPSNAGDPILCLINVTGSNLDVNDSDLRHTFPLPWEDTLTGRLITKSSFRMSPYEVLWLKSK
jgi:sucrose phosphorylase